MSELALIDLHVHPEIAVACAAAVAAALAWLWLAALAIANRRLRARNAALATGLEGARAGLAQAEALGTQAALRLQKLEQACGRLSERLRFVERRSDVRSFDLAIDSARHGSDSRRLAADFGLSRGEAELVARMHGRPNSA